jgi:hypothetical protein
MATIASWLKNYYGDALVRSMNPSVVMDGKNCAVVKITVMNTASPGYSRIGFVLLEKNGRHDVTPHLSLHEGVPTQKDMDRMTEVFKKADAD